MQDLTESILTDVIKPRPQESFKGTFGKLLLIGGNHQYGGAIIMAATAAVYSGAGLVTVACDPVNITALHTQLPEAMAIDFNDGQALNEQVQKADTIVIGPGLGEDDDSLAVMLSVFDNTAAHQIVVIDGSALTMLARESQPLPAGHIILTPHQMEWQRVSGIAINDQTPEANKQAQEKLGATVLVKKHHTEIYTPEGDWRLPIGSAAQAVGGMGDTLAGMVGGFCAQFRYQPTQAALAAAYAHSAIADEIAEHQYVVLPHQISHALPAFMKKVSESDQGSHIGFLN